MAPGMFLADALAGRMEVFRTSHRKGDLFRSRLGPAIEFGICLALDVRAIDGKS
jgi:hypothetical protein